MAMCAMGLITTTPSHAASWSFTPHAALNVGHDDNVRLSADASESSTAVLQLDSILKRASDRFEFSLAPQLTLARYDREAVLDRNDASVNTSLVRRRERSQWLLSGQYIRDTTLTSELGTTGFVDANATHESMQLAVAPTAQITERWSASLQAATMRHRYESDGESAGLVDYDYNSVLTKSSYSTNEYSALSLDVSWGRLAVPQNRTATEVNNYAANVSWQSAWNERWKLNLAVGPTRVESASFSDNGIGYSANLDRRSEQTTWQLSWSRDVTPNGRGVLSKRERADLSLSTQISERFSTSVSTQWIRSQDFLPSLALRSARVRYFFVSSALTWRVTPTVGISTSIGWTEQTAATAAEAYRASIGIVWNGLSRELH